MKSVNRKMLELERVLEYFFFLFTRAREQILRVSKVINSL